MNILKNFQISNYYKYLLYLAGILLIISLSIDTKVISNFKLLVISSLTILYGISCWIYEGNMTVRADNINLEWQFALSDSLDHEKKFREKYNPTALSKEYEMTRIIMFTIYIILLLFIIFIG